MDDNDGLTAITIKLAPYDDAFKAIRETGTTSFGLKLP
jgi:hypothetical protein